MTPAHIHLKAKSQDTWEALLPFINWLMRKSKVISKVDAQCGMYVKLDAAEAEFVYSLVCHHKLPLTVEVTVEAYQ